MTDREKYIERLFSKSNYDEAIKLDILADIAWSLSNIASMLMENNGYSECDVYLNGGQWETEDD